MSAYRTDQGVLKQTAFRSGSCLVIGRALDSLVSSIRPSCARLVPSLYRQRPWVTDSRKQTELPPGSGHETTQPSGFLGYRKGTPYERYEFLRVSSMLSAKLRLEAQTLPDLSLKARGVCWEVPCFSPRGAKSIKLGFKKQLAMIRKRKWLVDIRQKIVHKGPQMSGAVLRSLIWVQPFFEGSPFAWL